MASTMRALLIGAIGLVVGALLPWATLRSLYGTMNLAGYEGDGIITGAVGLLLLLVALARREGMSRGAAVVCLLFSLGACYVAANTVTNVSELVSNIGSPATIGIGLFITVPAAFLAAVGTGMALTQKQEEPAAPETPPVPDIPAEGGGESPSSQATQPSDARH